MSMFLPAKLIQVDNYLQGNDSRAKWARIAP